MKIIFIVTLMFLNSSLFAAEDIVDTTERCTQNSLDINQAHGRNAWAKKCYQNFLDEDPEFLELLSFYNSRGRPKYALVSDETVTRYDAPISTDSGCETFTKLRAFCMSSCYTPDQKILYKDGYTVIKDAEAIHKTNIVTLSKNSLLESLEFQVMPVDTYMKSMEDAKEVIKVVEMEDGHKLKITLGHPVLLSTGEMVAASSLKVGDLLIKADGEFEKIASLSEYEYFGKVYNVAPQSIDLLENIIVAEGYLMGSANYQFHEQFKDVMYRRVMRSLIDLSEFKE